MLLDVSMHRFSRPGFAAGVTDSELVQSIRYFFIRWSMSRLPLSRLRRYTPREACKLPHSSVQFGLGITFNLDGLFPHHSSPQGARNRRFEPSEFLLVRLVSGGGWYKFSF